MEKKATTILEVKMKSRNDKNSERETQLKGFFQKWKRNAE